MTQEIYIGATRKIGDIDLKHNRVYTSRPLEMISKLEMRGLNLAGKLFVSVKNFSKAAKEVETPGTVLSVANEQILDFKI